MVRALVTQKQNKFYPSNSLVEPILSCGGGITRSIPAFANFFNTIRFDIFFSSPSLVMKLLEIFVSLFYRPAQGFVKEHIETQPLSSPLGGELVWGLFPFTYQLGVSNTSYREECEKC